MSRNLQDFQLNYGSKPVENGYAAEVRFKQLMINNEKD